MGDVFGFDTFEEDSSHWFLNTPESIEKNISYDIKSSVLKEIPFNNYEPNILEEKDDVDNAVSFENTYILKRKEETEETNKKDKVRIIENNVYIVAEDDDEYNECYKGFPKFINKPPSMFKIQIIPEKKEVFQMLKPQENVSNTFKYIENSNKQSIKKLLPKDNIQSPISNQFNSIQKKNDIKKKVVTKENIEKKEKSKKKGKYKIYITKFELSIFKKCDIKEYIYTNKDYSILPLFSYFVLGKFNFNRFGTGQNINTIIQQYSKKSKNLSINIRNKISGRFDIFIDQDYDLIVKCEMDSYLINNKNMSLKLYFDIFPEKKKDLFKSISDIFKVIYWNYEYEIEDYFDITNGINSEEEFLNKKQEDVNKKFIEYLLNLSFSRSLKRKKEKEMEELKKYNEMLDAFNNSSIKCVTIESVNIDGIFYTNFGVNIIIDIYQVINYQLFNNIKKICFHVDKDFCLHAIERIDDTFIINVTDIYKKKR